jgi:hypothetical protein
MLSVFCTCLFPRTKVNLTPLRCPLVMSLFSPKTRRQCAVTQDADRALALAMSKHPRLGALSPARHTPSSILAYILSFLRQGTVNGNSPLFRKPVSSYSILGQVYITRYGMEVENNDRILVRKRGLLRGELPFTSTGIAVGFVDTVFCPKQAYIVSIVLRALAVQFADLGGRFGYDRSSLRFATLRSLGLGSLRMLQLVSIPK